VKLIQWREVVDRQRIKVLARSSKSLKDRLLQTISAPVVIDRLNMTRIIHGSLRPFPAGCAPLTHAL
jgi:hypothetical protein